MKLTVMINMVMAMAYYSAAKDDNFSGCLVFPSFNVTLVDRVQDLSFWGFVAASRGTSVMKVRLEQSPKEFVEVMLNYTHATAVSVRLTYNSPMWQGQVSGKEVVLPPMLNPLQFTVIGERPLPLMLTQADTDIIVTREMMDTLDAQIPPVPLVLRLTLDHTQSATLPQIVTEGVLGVVEVMIGSPIASLKFTSLCDGDVHVVQQLHLSTQAVMAGAAGQTTVAVPYQEETSSKDEPQYLEPLPVSAAWQTTSSLLSPCHGPKHIHEVVEFTTIKPTRTPKDSLSSEDDYDYLPCHFR
ncbi:hypothetical protein E2C01_000439 [Portunus trituberculatus]|uniref:Uncharacterized protein n=1 Tax=Portunus trituberculatus TaxID=210409 RepID=A0A5B7CE32_PORTR|nr:hypothetical protein [Portunus trituberculatus]